MNNSRDSQKTQKQTSKPTGNPFFPVNMQLSQLEQPKEFALIVGINVFCFNSCLTLNYCATQLT